MLTLVVLGLCAGCLAPDAGLGYVAESVVGTPTPSGYRAGYVVVRDLAVPLSTPAPGQVGTHWQIYWHEVQPSVARTPDLARVAARVTGAAEQGLSSWLSVRFYEDSGYRPAVATDSVGLPAGIPVVHYGSGACADGAPDYRSALLRAAYGSLVDDIVRRFPGVAGYIIEAGVDGETANVKSSGGCRDAQVEFERQVSCEAFREWVRWLMRTWRAATAKPLYVRVSVADCAGAAVWATEKRYMAYSAAQGLDVGYMSASLNARDGGGDWAYGSMAPWGVVQAGLGRSASGGAAFEPGLLPVHYRAAERAGAADQMVYKALAGGAAQLFFQGEWTPYISAAAWRVITGTLGGDAAWVVFHSVQANEYRRGAWEWSSSGWPGNFERGVKVVGPAPTRYCSTGLVDVGSHSYQEPAWCDVDGGTPGPAEGRNYQGYGTDAVVGFDVTDAGAVFNGTVWVTYLDDGIGSFRVAWKTAEGEQTRAIERWGSGTWVTVGVTVTDAVFDGGMPGGGDFEVRAGPAGLKVYRAVFEPGGSVSATPTQTAMGIQTVTPAPTFTSTPTVTPAPAPPGEGGDMELRWDPNLDGFRVEDGKVAAVKCGVWPAEGVFPGDTVYRLVSASFIAEDEAQGLHNVYVDVIDKTGMRLDGAVVEHGWPTSKYPAMDEVVHATVFGAQIAGWGLYANYDPNAVEYGPYWVRVSDGPSDVFYGMGLPGKRHVSFAVVYQKQVVAVPPQPKPLPEQEPRANVAILADKVRWWNQEARRAWEAGNYERVGAILAGLIDKNWGLLYRMERALKQLPADVLEKTEG